jgi:hypothetical protein
MKKFRFLLSEATNPNCEIPKFASKRDPPNAYLGFLVMDVISSRTPTMVLLLLLLLPLRFYS